MFQLSRADQESLIAFAQDLVRIPSPSTQEGEVAERLAQEMRRVGITDVWTDRIGNVIGRIGQGRGPKLFYDGHMDTVGIGDRTSWVSDPYGGPVQNGILYGLGAVDMKGALASMVYGAKALMESGLSPQGDLFLIGVVQEEPCEGLGVRVLVEEEGIVPDFVILGEATNLQIKRGHRGRMEISVTVHGRSCHASAPAQGENAIHMAARLIFGVELLTPHLLEDAFLGAGTLTVTHIESSAGSRNALPDRCTFSIDRRLTVGETEERALSEIEGVITREGARASISVAQQESVSYTGYRASVRDVYPAWVMPEGHPLIRQASRAIERALAFRPRCGRWNFSTDGAYTMGVAGIPTIGFGPGEEKYAHTTDDQVPVSDLIRAAQGYAAIAAEVLNAR
ncbi:MAG: YgeY family selenium metabolism-linked hydrolase [Chloroflexi bacterium]|nr:YgeY family selenium metabolism-linked hydrolase [Chloroflexota bacterium]